MNKLGLIILSAIVLLAACTMPQTRVYTIHLPSVERALKTGSDVSVVINVNSEDHLKQPYIVYRQGKYELSISKYSKWELSPRRMVGRKFKEAMTESKLFTAVRTTNIPLKGNYTLKINLKSFEGRDSGVRSFASLKFNISLYAPDGKEIYKSVISGEEEMEIRDFTNLAESMSSLLAQGLEESIVHIYEALED